MLARSVALFGALLVPALVAGAVGFGAQATSHTLFGTVTGPDGHSLPGVVVELSLPTSTGSLRTVVTGRDGRYRFERIVPGLYVLTARLAGFSPSIRDLEIADGSTEFQFDMQLTPVIADDATRVPAASGPRRRVVCGLTMISPFNVDPKMIAPGQPSPPAAPFNDRLFPGQPSRPVDRPQVPVKPTMRTVQPGVCWDPLPALK